MAVELVDPFSQGIPQVLLDSFLEAPQACTAKFSPSGSLLATGSHAGYIFIWDTDTWDLTKALYSHVAQITNVSWAEGGYRLLSSSKDWTCILWDMNDLDDPFIIRAHMPFTASRFLPGEDSKFIALPLFGPPRIYTVNWKSRTKSFEELTFEDSNYESQSDAQYCCLEFDKERAIMYLGNLKGTIFVISMKNQNLIYSLSLGSSRTAAKQIHAHSSGSYLLVNGQDRAIRSYFIFQGDDSFSLELENKFQDLVDRTPWSHVMYSPDAEYIISGCGVKPTHNLYIWDRTSGNLVKMLEGPKDVMDGFDWHPSKALITSVSSMGFVYRWAATVKENWSAFAPGFEELEENIAYEEREDEYDIYSDKEEDYKVQIKDEDVDIEGLEEEEKAWNKQFRFPCIPDPVIID